MNKTQEKAFCKEVTKQLRELEAVINHKLKFSSPPFCHSRELKCSYCPLRPCITLEFPKPAEYLYTYLPKKKFMRVAKNRYRWLIQKIRKAGYEYK